MTVSINHSSTHPDLEKKIIATLQTIFDPEIPVNIYELGLIYAIEIDEKNRVKILMTVTAPNCPVADSLPVKVKDKIKEIQDITDAEVEITFNPPWTPEKMSEAARLQLGFL